MQDTRYILLVLLSSLLMLTGCSRRELLDDYPVSGVDIKLDWNGVTDKLPGRGSGDFLSEECGRQKD